MKVMRNLYKVFLVISAVCTILFTGLCACADDKLPERDSVCLYRGTAEDIEAMSALYTFCTDNCIPYTLYIDTLPADRDTWLGWTSITHYSDCSTRYEIHYTEVDNDLVLAHEIAHCIKFTDTYTLDSTQCYALLAEQDNLVCSDYQLNNLDELFAQTVALYVCHPDYLRCYAPKSFDIAKDVLATLE